MTEQAIMNLSLWVCILTLLLVAGVAGVGLYLVQRRLRPWPHPLAEEVLLRLLHDDRNARQETIRGLIEFSSDSRARRNEFWIAYGQIVLSLFLVTILAILLLTKTIDPDAGLPILAAVSGFTIAKATSSGRERTNLPIPPQSQQG